MSETPSAVGIQRSAGQRRTRGANTRLGNSGIFLIAFSPLNADG